MLVHFLLHTMQFQAVIFDIEHDSFLNFTFPDHQINQDRDKADRD